MVTQKIKNRKIISKIPAKRKDLTNLLNYFTIFCFTCGLFYVYINIGHLQLPQTNTNNYKKKKRSLLNGRPVDIPVDTKTDEIKADEDKP